MEIKRNTILIAFIRAETQNYIQSRLISSGYTVYQAVNGQQVINKAESCVPDLILMDISLPDMDALEVTRIIRLSDGKIREIPIFVNALFIESFYARAQTVGCNELIRKPIDYELLKVAVRKYLSH
jgi:two-component system, cell cycle response regulator DivK